MRTNIKSQTESCQNSELQDGRHRILGLRLHPTDKLNLNWKSVLLIEQELSHKFSKIPLFFLDSNFIWV